MSHHRHDTSYRIVQLEHSLCTCVDLGIAGRSTFPETNIRVQDKKNGDQNTSECRLDLQRSRIGFKVSTRESTHRPAVLHTALYLNIGIISILIYFTNVTIFRDIVVNDCRSWARLRATQSFPRAKTPLLKAIYLCVRALGPGVCWL